MIMRILIADACEIVRQGIESLLDSESGMEVAGQAGDGEVAVRLAYELRPDVIVMDVELPGLNGIDATRQIVQKLPNVKVIAFSSHLNSRSACEMFKAGALGYVSRQCACRELITAIKAVAVDEVYLSPDMTDVVIRDYVYRSSKNDTSPYSPLTDKERQVLQLIAEGRTTKGMAEELDISRKTVEYRRNKIRQKLNVRSIAELTKYALREGICCGSCQEETTYPRHIPGRGSTGSRGQLVSAKDLSSVIFDHADAR